MDEKQQEIKVNASKVEKLDFETEKTIRQAVYSEVIKYKVAEFMDKRDIANEIIEYATMITEQTSLTVPPDLIFRAILSACRGMSI